MNKKHSGFINITLAILAVLILGGAGYYFYQKSPPLPQNPAPTPQPQAVQTPPPSPNPAANETAGWKTYTNTQYGFSLQYPSDKVRVIEANNNSNNEIVYFGLTSHEVYHNPWLNELTVSVNTAKDCSGYEKHDSGYEFIKHVQLGTEVFAQTDVSIDYHGMNSRGSYVLAYCLKKNGTMYEIRDRSGGKDPTVQQVLQTFKLVPASNNSISVPGMTKYTDSDFGFSFWYPSMWQVNETKVPDANMYVGGTITKEFEVGPPNKSPFDKGVVIREYNSADRTITDPPSCGAMGNCAGALRYYFDVDAHTWMMQYPNGYSGEGGSAAPGTTQTANVSTNSMGGLHMLSGNRHDTIVPLSAKNFVVLVNNTTESVGGPDMQDFLAKTIVATDPSVATPISIAEQIKIIQAEKDAYTAN